MRKRLAVLWCMAVSLWAAAEFTFDQQDTQLLLCKDGKPWLSTQIAPFDANRAEETYKVYTHIYDFDGSAPITKGPGGKYTHHRGLFIGWNKTLVGQAEESFDTWHMKDCFQRHAAWLDLQGGADRAVQREKVLWCRASSEPFIEEERAIAVTEGTGGARIIDFTSQLTSVAGTIKLGGDLQHAGMQVRMENEVSEHEDSTQYILPEGARELEDDKVVGAWWVCCSPVVRDKRYWLVHMTANDLVTGQPVYSIRRYARFGAFFEPVLDQGKPLTVRFRVAVSDRELDKAACEALYQEYVKGGR